MAAFFGGLGLDGSALRPDALLPLLLNAGTSLLGLGTAIFFVLAYVIYLAVDAARFRDIPAEVAASHAMRIRTFRDFADGTSRYYLVNSIFGLIVAVIDGLALWALGIPAPFAWAVLAFVTNYIPNIGFVIGLIPPVVLAIVTGGWGLGLLVVAIYCAVNVVLQVLVQPRFVEQDGSAQHHADVLLGRALDGAARPDRVDPGGSAQPAAAVPLARRRTGCAFGEMADR